MAEESGTTQLYSLIIRHCSRPEMPCTNIRVQLLTFSFNRLSDLFTFVGVKYTIIIIIIIIQSCICTVHVLHTFTCTSQEQWNFTFKMDSKTCQELSIVRSFYELLSTQRTCSAMYTCMCKWLVKNCICQ